MIFFFFSSRRRHTRCGRDWSSDVCSSDLRSPGFKLTRAVRCPDRNKQNGLTSNDRYLRASGKIDDYITLEEQGLSSFNGNYAQFCLGSDVNCFDTDYRHIETHVLIRLGDLYHNRVLTREGAATPDRVVRSFERFYRNDSSIFHDDSLPNVEPCDFLGHLPAAIDIFFLASTKLRSRNQSRRRKTVLQKCCGWQKIDIYPGQFICNRRKDGFRIALFQFSQQKQRFQIRTQIKKILRRDLTGHDHVMNLVFVKKFQQSIQLSDAHPFDQINILREGRIGLASECGRNYFSYASFLRRISKQSGIYAVSGDNSQDLWTRHSEQSEAKSKNPALKPKRWRHGIPRLSSE